MPPTLTTVRFSLDALGDGQASIAGRWTFTPGRAISSQRVIVPRPFTVTPTAEEVTAGAFTLDLLATDDPTWENAWAWTIREPYPGTVRTVLVPTGVHREYADLPDVDADGLTLPAPPNGYVAALRDLARRVAMLEADGAFVESAAHPGLYVRTAPSGLNPETIIPNTPAGVDGYLTNYLGDLL